MINPFTKGNIICFEKLVCSSSIKSIQSCQTSLAGGEGVRPMGVGV